MPRISPPQLSLSRACVLLRTTFPELSCLGLLNRAIYMDQATKLLPSVVGLTKERSKLDVGIRSWAISAFAELSRN